jgi:hypothetical protein
MQEKDFFEGIKQAPVKVGPKNVPFPLFYRDVAYLGVFLLAPLDAAKNILPSKRMHPFRLTPWHGIVTITVSEHKDSDIGPYNAVSIGVPFVLDKASPVFTGILRTPPEVPMIYLLHLPVTTEIARDSGVAVANFPESLADISFKSDEQWVNCKVDAEGKNIMRLSARKLGLSPLPRQRVYPITLRQDRLLRSELNYSESRAGISKKQSDVKLEFGEHPIGSKLKELNLGRVLQYQYYPAGQAVLSMVIESYSI